MFSHLSVAHTRHSYTVWTKKFHLDNDRRGFAFVLAPTLFARERIEQSIIDAFSQTQSILLDRTSYLSSVLEKINTTLEDKALQKDLEEVKIFIALTQERFIDFSIRNSLSVSLVKDGGVSDISEGMNDDAGHFSYISSGSLGIGEYLIVSTEFLLTTLNKEDVLDCMKIPKQERQEIIQALINRNDDPISLLILSHEGDEGLTEIPEESSMVIPAIFKKSAQYIGQEVKEVINKTKETAVYAKANETYEQITQEHKRPIRLVLFVLGIGVSIALLYVIISTLFTVQIESNQPSEIRAKLIEAQLILERSRQDIANKEVFTKNIEKAESLIFEVREKQVFLNDVKNLLETVSILKKQLNGIDTFDVNGKTPLITLPKDFQAIRVFRIDGKFLIVGKNSILGPLAVGTPIKPIPYPEGEEALSADINGDNILFILTRNGSVLRYTKSEFSGVNVDGQKTWEAAKEIHTFNSNLYLLSAEGTDIFRHKPGISGYGTKSPMIPRGDFINKPVLDMAIDGSFYVLKSDLSIDKIFTAPTYQRRSIVINGLPEGYQYKGGNLALQTSQNALHLTLLMDGKIWIFEPDNRNFKDVKALKYLGQIEFAGDEIQTYFLEKNGQIIAAGKNGIHSVLYDVNEGKIVVRNL